jgi:hypothetical protein
MSHRSLLGEAFAAALALLAALYVVSLMIPSLRIR